MKEITIGLLGFGTVGAGVARLLIDNRNEIRSRLGAELRLKRVADIDTRTDRGVRLDDGVLVADALAVVDDPEIDIIVEMIGGLTAAKEFILRAIDTGKAVVTANKALLAEAGNEIFRTAADRGVDLAYEASVGGCMPIIKTLRESLAGNQIRSMTGILNGTCNYILSRITDEGLPFATALAEAQTSGFAEADPTLDVEGYDTAHKLAIINALAYGMEINLADIHVEGISGITPMDIAFARQFGYKIKLLAISKVREDAVEARIHPTMIPCGNPLSTVGANLNAITVNGDAVGDIMLYGYGAGMMPTASAVVGDIVDLARNRMTGAEGRIPLLARPLDRIRPLPVLPISEITTNYYIRFSALDRPGVLSSIAGILGEHGISIKSVHQKGRQSQGAVPIVMLSHLARERDVRDALAKIGRLDAVGQRPTLIRIEDENGDIEADDAE
jgi:homoserine dehydrogenase